MIFLATVSVFNVLPLGGLFVYSPLAAITHFLGHFGFSFKFSMCYPKGAHSLGHRWLQLLTFGAFRIQFQIFNVLPQGGSFKTPPFRQLLTFWAFQIKFQIFNVLPQGAHSITHRWLQLLTFGAFWIQFKLINVLPQGCSFVYPPEGAAISYFWVQSLICPLSWPETKKQEWAKQVMWVRLG